MSTRFRTWGESVVEKYPKLKAWTLPSRNNIDDLKLRTYAGFYHPLRHIELQSIYPIPQGYEDNQALGLRMDLGDSLGVSHIASTFSYSPPGPAGQRDRFHVGLEANYWDWKFSAYFNRADFYDLFGPTKVGRRGFALIGEKSKNSPPRSGPHARFDYQSRRLFRPGRLPDYQNVTATHTQVVSGQRNARLLKSAKISRRNRRRKRYCSGMLNGQSWTTRSRSSFRRYGENTRADSCSRSETPRFGFALRQAARLAMRAILSQTSTLAPSGTTGSTKAISAATANTTVFPAFRSIRSAQTVLREGSWPNGTSRRCTSAT